jgi:hypothetical protein
VPGRGKREERCTVTALLTFIPAKREGRHGPGRSRGRLPLVEASWTTARRACASSSGAGHVSDHRSGRLSLCRADKGTVLLESCSLLSAINPGRRGQPNERPSIPGCDSGRTLMFPERIRGNETPSRAVASRVKSGPKPSRTSVASRSMAINCRDRAGPVGKSDGRGLSEESEAPRDRRSSSIFHLLDPARFATRQREELPRLIAGRFPGPFIGRAFLDEMARIDSARRVVFNDSLRDEAAGRPPGRGAGQADRRLVGVKHAKTLVDSQGLLDEAVLVTWVKGRWCEGGNHDPRPYLTRWKPRPAGPTTQIEGEAADGK